VVSAPAWVQRRRVLARPGMTQARLDRILRLQTRDAIKRRRADFIIETAAGRAMTRACVRRLVACLSQRTGRYDKPCAR
jgi:dephospho-CoA kinase